MPRSESRRAADGDAFSTDGEAPLGARRPPLHNEAIYRVLAAGLILVDGT